MVLCRKCKLLPANIYDCREPQGIQLSVHPDRLYLANAGGLPSGWSVRRLFQKHGSETRNWLIANAFYRGGFVETWGRGIDKVCRECKRLGVSMPKYEVTASDVMVSLEALITRPDIQLEGTKSAPSQAPSQALSQQLMSLYDQIIAACAEPQSARSLMKLSGRTDLTKFRQSVLVQMLAEGVLALTIPDVPNSRLQKYRTTEKGKSALRKRIEMLHGDVSIDPLDETINDGINETLKEAKNDPLNDPLNDPIKCEIIRFVSSTPGVSRGQLALK